MKLKIKQKILMEHLNYVIKGISSKNLIPILNCIKFDLKTEGLYLMSTDNEIAIKTFIDAKDIEEIEEKGDIVVAGKYIYDIIRKLSNETINLEEIMSSQLLITTDTSSFKLNCNKVEDFPNLDLEFSKKPLIINQQAFKTTINQTIFATSTQESRPVLTGINFKIKKNKLECTATDSYRLARKEIEISEEVEQEVDIIVPSKNLLEVIRLLNNDEDNLELHIFNNKIIFNFDSLIIMSRLINGAYPDTNKLIPQAFEIKIKVNLDKFFTAIDRASLLTSEEEKNIIKLESKGEYLLISSNIPEIGNVEEKVEIDTKADESVKIAFSSRYMMDALKIFESNEIELKYNGEVKPIIITDGENDNLLQLILPIRTY
jgi:DNA polymerase III, beta subunit